MVLGDMGSEFLDFPELYGAGLLCFYMVENFLRRKILIWTIELTIFRKKKMCTDTRHSDEP